jgi:tetratricopeptide (TPR) repeat protein|tara:strand:- start:974 stop:1312 length:339 start_codon:yes stop_codon:yes gene_type:complete
MGLLDKIKKSIELKQSTPSFESINKTENKILKLKKQFEKNPDNCKILTELYTCYVEISDTEKKIECLKKISQLSPNDFYSFQQLADIYLNELDNASQAQIYQNHANKIKNSF